MRRLRLVEAGDLSKRGVFGRDLALRDFRRYLGQSRDGLCYDASGGLFPNAFTALAGTVTDGHDLRLYLPSAYPDGDPDHRRLLDFGVPTDGCADFFNARLRREKLHTSNEMQLVGRFFDQVYSHQRLLFAFRLNEWNLADKDNVA